VCDWRPPTAAARPGVMTCPDPPPTDIWLEDLPPPPEVRQVVGKTSPAQRDELQLGALFSEQRFKQEKLSPKEYSIHLPSLKPPNSCCVCFNHNARQRAWT